MSLDDPLMPEDTQERPRSVMGKHPKSVRRRILQLLYQHYLDDPLEMVSPEELLADGSIAREGLVPNAHYLNDRSLIELMYGYHPPFFAAVRITANGIDLVENEFVFNLRFPPESNSSEAAVADIPALMERLVEEADYSPLDGEARHCLLRDVQFLRDEFARPVGRWRKEVILTVLDWIAAHAAKDEEEGLPSLSMLRSRAYEVFSEET